MFYGSFVALGKFGVIAYVCVLVGFDCGYLMPKVVGVVYIVLIWN